MEIEEELQKEIQQRIDWNISVAGSLYNLRKCHPTARHEIENKVRENLARIKHLEDELRKL